MAVAIIPRILGLGAQKCFWWGFRKQKVRVGVGMVTRWVGGGPVGADPGQGARGPSLAKKALSRPLGWLIVGALVKYPGQGGQGHEMLQPKATGWLLHQPQPRLTEGRSAIHLEGGGTCARASWRTHLPLFKVRSLRESGLPHILPLPESPVGMAP